MRLIDSNPEYAQLSDQDLLKVMAPTLILSQIQAIADAVDDRTPIELVSQIYLPYRISSENDQEQIPCPLPTHGGVDRNPSARLYRFDRQNNKRRDSIHCFKCNKTVSMFWLAYIILKETRDMRPIEIISEIIFRFNVPLPRNVILNQDPEDMSSIDKQRPRINIEPQLTTAAKIRNFKITNQDQYLNLLRILIQNPSTIHQILS